ncbi:uncharacterized protein LOC106052166 isoform X2 [Biomphalaria glabrata]|uniref:Poly [ADP-ribose] polymerase n=1 Tax=Biomphalaria glabrata TaxID=6526 RepID=A0A9W2YXR9_BIOGL|nr:uncharacterized protein LOC106052166 isoform X2 [Biomphalaria glabrata]
MIYCFILGNENENRLEFRKNKKKMEGLGMTNQVPESLVEPDDPFDSPFLLQELNPTDRSYREIEIDFENADLKVIKVEKLRNAHLCKRYLTERKLMLEQRLSLDPQFNLNEKFLYHGTSTKKDFVCEEGLDSRMSKQGCFGKGIYFSDYPKKCLKYAERGGHNNFILLMRVILGESKMYPKGVKDKYLVREPEKEAPYRGYRFYDSVQGCPVNHQEFVVYENRRALVEYIITYQKKDKELVGKNLETDSVVLSRDSKPSRIEDSGHSSDSSHSDGSSYRHLGPYRHLGQGDSSGNTTDEEENTLAKSFQKNVNIRQNIPDSSTFDVSAEKLLYQNKAEFTRLTGVTDDYLIDHCLLRGNMDLNEAVKLYNAHGDGIKDSPLPDIPREFEEELMAVGGRPSHPEPGTIEWQNLSEEHREAIIAGLIEDFLHVAGLPQEETDYAKKRLASTGNNLDLAIVAHYEDM